MNRASPYAAASIACASCATGGVCSYGRGENHGIGDCSPHDSCSHISRYCTVITNEYWPPRESLTTTVYEVAVGLQPDVTTSVSFPCGGVVVVAVGQPTEGLPSI